MTWQPEPPDSSPAAALDAEAGRADAVVPAASASQPPWPGSQPAGPAAPGEAAVQPEWAAAEPGGAGPGGAALQPGWAAAEPAGAAVQPEFAAAELAVRPTRSRRTGRKLTAFAALLAAGLAGLGVAAIGIAHQLLPREFTVAQQSQIATWEMERRWRALPAGKIFPALVPYQLSAVALNASGGLALDAQRLGIAPQASCADVVSAAAVSIVARYRCTDAIRATYVDASGSMVATVAVLVLPGPAAARAVVVDLTHSADLVLPVRAFRVARTPAASFGQAERQLARAVAAGPYVILSTAGFADGRHRIGIRGDYYLDQEMTSLTVGLTGAAAAALGSQPPPPVCPGAPGC